MPHVVRSYVDLNKDISPLNGFSNVYSIPKKSGGPNGTVSTNVKAQYWPIETT